MKKAILISVAALLIFAIPALADDNLGGQSSTPKPEIEMLGFLGKGIASLPSDPANFMIIKVGVGRVKVISDGNETKVTIGILFADDKKYRIKDLVIDNGSVTGNLYLNDTQVGSISVKSIMKGDTEVWAGTLTLDGTTYNLHILQAHREIKNNEMKEKIKEYCNDSGDGNCSSGIEAYCQNNPTNTRCMALFKAFCIRKNNMDDSRCRDFMAGWCNNTPENTDCRLLAVERSTKYCAENPNTPTCNALTKKLADFCSTDPGSEKCNQACQQHSEVCKNVVKNLAEFCLENANNSQCLQYCRNHPGGCVKIASGILNQCIQNPNATEKCKEYCKEHPAACRIVSTELAAFCITNQNNTRCQSFCQNYPDACANVTEKIEGYCTVNTNNALCRSYCKRFPDKCVITPSGNEDEQACTNSGGTVTTATCCTSANNFPNTCLIGACGCSPENSKEVNTCDCGEGNCFNGNSCVNQNQTLNESQGGQ